MTRFRLIWWDRLWSHCTAEAVGLEEGIDAEVMTRPWDTLSSYTDVLSVLCFLFCLFFLYFTLRFAELKLMWGLKLSASLLQFKLHFWWMKGKLYFFGMRACLVLNCHTEKKRRRTGAMIKTFVYAVARRRVSSITRAPELTARRRTHSFI